MSPLRPEGVTIERANGEVIPVELAYAGQEEDGTYVWSCMTPFGDGDQLHVALLPARTSIALLHRHNGDEHP